MADDYQLKSSTLETAQNDGYIDALIATLGRLREICPDTYKILDTEQSGNPSKTNINVKSGNWTYFTIAIHADPERSFTSNAYGVALGLRKDDTLEGIDTKILELDIIGHDLDALEQLGAEDENSGSWLYYRIGNQSALDIILPPLQ